MGTTNRYYDMSARVLEHGDLNQVAMDAKRSALKKKEREEKDDEN